MSQNVFYKVVKDVDKINETFSKAGLEESLIGGNVILSNILNQILLKFYFY